MGLPGTARRRTPGLRREEVAALAGVGVSWYSWLEQGKVAASAQVLRSVSRALRLDETAYRHAMALAGIRLEAACPDGTGLATRLGPMLAGWPTSPALLVDRALDVLSWNEAYAAVWGDPGSISVAHRNLVHLVAGHPGVRETVVEWESFGRLTASLLRERADRYPDHPRIVAVYDSLNRDLPDLAAWWRCRGVSEPEPRTLTWTPPTEEPVRFALHLLHPHEDPDATIVLHEPAAGPDRAAVVRAVERNRARHPERHVDTRGSAVRECPSISVT